MWSNLNNNNDVLFNISVGVNYKDGNTKDAKLSYTKPKIYNYLVSICQICKNYTTTETNLNIQSPKWSKICFEQLCIKHL